MKIIYLLVITFAILRVATINYNYPEGKKIRITARVTTEPIYYDNRQLVQFSSLAAYVDLFPQIVYGDTVTLEGTVEESKLVNARIVNVSQSSGLYKMRERILSVYKNALPVEHAALIGGIVVGSKAGMPSSFWDKLKSSGTAHVVVASGMNVAFVTSFFLNSLINFVNRRKAIILALLGAWAYVVLSGLDAPLVRAAIMGSIAFGAQAVGRLSFALRTLFLSALVMIIIKPDWAYDLGFILSFTATLSMILFEKKISSLFSKLPFLFKKDLATTLAAQIGVAPILLVSFGQLNLLSPLINSLVLWTIPPIMIIGAAAGVIGLIIPRLGEFVTYLAYPFTLWFISVVGLTS